MPQINQDTILQVLHLIERLERSIDAEFGSCKPAWVLIQIEDMDDAYFKLLKEAGISKEDRIKFWKEGEESWRADYLD